MDGDAAWGATAAPDEVIEVVGAVVVEDGVGINGLRPVAIRLWIRSATAVANWLTADSNSGRDGETDGVEEGVVATAVGGDGPSNKTVTELGSVESITLKKTRDDKNSNDFRSCLL